MLITKLYFNKEKKSSKNYFLMQEEDRAHLQPFPVPVIIIGGKYDIFQVSATENKIKNVIQLYENTVLISFASVI